MTQVVTGRGSGQRIFLLLAILVTLTACDTPLASKHYLPANSGADPYQAVRAKAEQYYQAGISAEQNGNLAQALKDYRQARQWDHDGRQDIQSALSRVQAQVSPQSQVQPTSTNSDSGVAMRQFDSHIFPYSISVPDGWTTTQGGTKDLPTDTFTETSSGNVKAVLTIMVGSASFGVTLDELYVGSKRSLESAGVKDVQIVGRRKIDGQPAYVMSYQTTSGAEVVLARHAIFVTPSHAWHIILLAAPSASSEQVKTFNAILDSFQFKSSAFPVQ